VHGNGHGPAQTVAQQHGMRARRRLAKLYLFAGAIIAVIAVAAGFYAVFGGFHFGGGWVTVGSLADVQRKGVFYDRTVNAFVIADSGEMIAVLAENPHGGERVYYCPSSGWFQSPAEGSTFDHRGYYRLGPAPRGLDRVKVRTEHGFVSVDTSQRAPGPARGLTDERPAAGPRCADVPGDPVTGRIGIVPVGG
jgi:hypothetical protein